MKHALFALALLSACATQPAPPARDASEIIAAERAFAADAAARGWVASFKSYAAAEAITLSPGPVNAQENLAQQESPGTTALDWRPSFAGVARSGDFGFTTGPYQFRGRDGIVGHYFTVWRKQPDGNWKWIFDGGVRVADPGPATEPDAIIPELPIAAAGAGSAENAVEQVRLIEELPEHSDARVDFWSWLADDAYLKRAGAPVAIGKAAASALAGADPQTRTSNIERQAAPSGDMVFSLGELRDDEQVTGYFARMWQLQPAGWRIVFDEIVPFQG